MSERIKREVLKGLVKLNFCRFAKISTCENLSFTSFTKIGFLTFFFFEPKR